MAGDRKDSIVAGVSTRVIASLRRQITEECGLLRGRRYLVTPLEVAAPFILHAAGPRLLEGFRLPVEIAHRLRQHRG